jgi:hypothetical protein
MNLKLKYYLFSAPPDKKVNHDLFGKQLTLGLQTDDFAEKFLRICFFDP